MIQGTTSTRNVYFCRSELIWNTRRFPVYAASLGRASWARTRVEGELRSYPRAKNITYTRDFRVAGWSTQRPTSSMALSPLPSPSPSFSRVFSSRALFRVADNDDGWERWLNRDVLLLNWNTLPSGAHLKYARAEAKPRISPDPCALRDCTIFGF